MKSYKIKQLELNQSSLKRLHDQYKSRDNKINFEDFHKLCKGLRIIPELLTSQELRHLCSKVTAHPSKLCLTFIHFEQMLKLIASSVNNGGDRLRSLLNSSQTFRNSEQSEEDPRGKRHAVRSIRPKKTMKKPNLIDIGLRSASILPRNKSPKNSSTARISTSPYKVKPGYFSNYSASLLVNKRKSLSPSTPTKANKEENKQSKTHIRTLSGGFFAKNNKPQNPSFAPARSSVNEVLKKVQKLYGNFIFNHMKLTSETPELFKNSVLRQNLNHKKCPILFKKTGFSNRFVMQIIFNAWKSLKK